MTLAHTKPLRPIHTTTEELASIEEEKRIPARGLYTEEARQERLDFLRDHSDTALDHLQETSLDPQKLTGNIENFIGAVEVPVGLAGPLLFNGQHAQGTFYAPMATSEGALVASATRGASAITRSGGVTTLVVHQRMMRVPLFVLRDMRSAFEFSRWLREHARQIQDQVREVSRHAELLSIEPTIMGSNVHVTFLYETGDAAGQNMTTACTWHCCQWILEQLRQRDDILIENFFIEANMSGDKKVTFQSLINGRGIRVTAEAVITDEELRRTLKTDKHTLGRAIRNAIAGSTQIGMVGFNINVANVIAAMFTATGQDIASVHESSLGQLHLQEVDEGLYASMTLPALIVGTVGGGTSLPRQKQLLESMGCHGPGKVSKLAEIIAGYCLALDLSTMAAIASGQFVAAHERLGRNRPVEFFTGADLTPDFFTEVLREQHDRPNLEVTEVDALDSALGGSSIITELTGQKIDKLVGLFPHKLALEEGGATQELDVMVKVKPLDAEVILMTSTMASMCSPRLASAHRKVKQKTGFKDVHTRELGVYRQTDPRFTRHVPAIHGIFEEPSRETYVLVMEHLDGMIHMDSANDIKAWTRAQKEAVIDGAAQLHSIWYRREDELLEQPWLGDYRTTASMTASRELLLSLGVHAFEEFPEWVSVHDLELHHILVRDIPMWWRELERQPRTLIHNDFNPRNFCLRPGKDGAGTLCVYDWELATIGLPQHDLAEFLSFMCTPQTTLEEVEYYSELHRKALAHYSKLALDEIDEEEWRTGLICSLYDLAIHRFAMYIMAHTFRHYPFMERAVRTIRHLIRLLRGL